VLAAGRGCPAGAFSRIEDAFGVDQQVEPSGGRGPARCGGCGTIDGL